MRLEGVDLHAVSRFWKELVGDLGDYATARVDWAADIILVALAGLPNGDGSVDTCYPTVGLKDSFPET